MTKLLSTVAAGALALFGATTVHADTFGPGLATAEFMGSVNIQKMITLTCTMSMRLQTNWAGTGAIVDTIDLTGGLCGIVDFPGFFTLDATTGTTVDFQNLVGVSSLAPSPCGPTTVSATWSSGGQSFTFPATDIGPPGCLRFGSGSVSKISGPTLTILP